MAETPSETHNRLARDFVMMAGTQTHSREQLLVVVESVMLGSLQLMVKLHGADPAHASILLEAALQNARFNRKRHVIDLTTVSCRAAPRNR